MLSEIDNILYSLAEVARVPSVLVSISAQIASAAGAALKAEETVRVVVAPAELVRVLLSTRVVSVYFNINASVEFAAAFAFAASDSLLISCKV